MKHFILLHILLIGPQQVIKFATHLERLFKQQPNYSLLRVFGCACWPNLRPYNNHKLQFRSRDVTFDENVFPFSTLHENAGARLRSEISLLPSSLLPLRHSGGEQSTDHMSHLHTNTVPGEIAAENNVSGTDDWVDEAIDQEQEENQQQQHSAQQQQQSEQPSASGSPSPARTSTASSQPGSATSPHVHASDASAASTADGTQNESGTNQTETNTILYQIDAAAPEGLTGPGPVRPHTHLQSGIRKEKVYTDGTVKWSGFISSGESQFLDEAFTNKNWKEVMDAEYHALIKNQTWHLVSPQAGGMSLTASGYTK